MKIKCKQIVSIFLLIYFLATVSAPVFAEELITEYRAIDSEEEPYEELPEDDAHPENGNGEEMNGEEIDEEEEANGEEDGENEAHGEENGEEEHLEPIYGPVYAIVGGVAFLGILTLVYLIFG